MNNGAVHNLRLLTSPGPANKQITLLPTSTEELSIPPALLFTKDQTQEIKSTREKVKALKVNCGCEQ